MANRQPSPIPTRNSTCRSLAQWQQPELEPEARAVELGLLTQLISDARTIPYSNSLGGGSGVKPFARRGQNILSRLRSARNGLMIGAEDPEEKLPDADGDGYWGKATSVKDWAKKLPAP
jgi:hypothetical protein